MTPEQIDLILKNIEMQGRINDSVNDSLSAIRKAITGVVDSIQVLHNRLKALEDAR